MFDFWPGLKRMEVGEWNRCNITSFHTIPAILCMMTVQAGPCNSAVSQMDLGMVIFEMNMRMN